MCFKNLFKKPEPKIIYKDKIVYKDKIIYKSVFEGLIDLAKEYETKTFTTIPISKVSGILNGLKSDELQITGSGKYVDSNYTLLDDEILLKLYPLVKDLIQQIQGRALDCDDRAMGMQFFTNYFARYIPTEYPFALLQVHGYFDYIGRMGKHAANVSVDENLKMKLFEPSWGEFRPFTGELTWWYI